MNIRNNAVRIAAVFLWAQALICAAAKDDNLLLEANYQINGMIWSADGSLFGVSEDNTFVIYDSVTEQVRRSFPVRRSFVADAAFSQSADSSRTGGSEQFVSLLSADGTIELWSYTHDVLLDTVSIGEDVRSNGFAVSPGTEYLGAGLSDGRIRVYMRLQYTNRLLARDITGHEKLVYSLAFTPDGKYLVSASLDNTIRVWETASGVCAAVIKYKPRGRIPVRCIQGSALAAPDSEAGTAPEGPFIVGVSGSRYITIWDMQGTELARIKTKGKIVDFDVSADGSVIRTHRSNGRIEFYSVADGSYLGHIKTLATDEIEMNGYAFSPFGTDVLISYSDGSVYRLLVQRAFEPQKGADASLVLGAAAADGTEQ